MFTRRDIMFFSKGLRCAGWYYVPDGLVEGEKAPVVVLGHGFGGIKEMILDNFASAFAEAGFVALAFDYRFMGESEGEPRDQQLPWDNQEDYRNAISWVSSQPEVDPERIGIWGTSYSGTHVIQVAAFDQRVKAVICQANGTLGSLDAFSALMGREAMEGYKAMLLADRVHRYETGEEVTYIPFVAPPGQPCAVQMEGAYEFFTTLQTNVCPTWENRTTMETLEKMLEGDLSIARTLVSPAPILVVLCEKDDMVPVELARRFIDTMGEPKEVVSIPCTHLEIYYTEPFLSQAVASETAFLKKYLGG
jgi:hypothetical protein